MINIKTFYSSVVLSLLVFAQPGFSQDDSHREAVIEFLQVSGASTVIDQTFDQMVPSLQGMAAQLGVSEEQRPIFDKYMRLMMEDMRAAMTWERLEPLLVEVYSEVFTEEEVREMTEFYGTPIGQKMKERMPELAIATSNMTQQLLVEVMPVIQQRQQELIEELAATSSN
ncbi:MAG: DUF2059 domain-containing protein [Pseudomonadota bacterium]